MNTLLTLTQQEIDPASALADRDSFLHRRSARAVLLNAQDGVALLHATKFDYYKLPGGGIEDEETEAEALVREIREETGYEAEMVHHLGRTIEYRDFVLLKEDSACFIARAVGSQGAVDMEDSEVADGLEVMWADNIDHAVSLMASIVPGDDMRLEFLQRREIAILLAAQQYMEGTL